MTQGDNTAMSMYSIGVKPLIDGLAQFDKPERLCQVWFADDSSGGGKLEDLKIGWMV